MKKTSPHGILLVDKPEDISSHGVVAKLRRLLDTKTIGHTGTLDPMATGLLILLVGEYTRLSNYIMAQDKIYDAEITFGRATDSDDAEGKTVQEISMPPITTEKLQNTLKQFLGRQMQTPPAFSAISVGGEKLYKKARRGEKVQVAPREIEVMNIDILEVLPNRCALRIHCSKGTYIRSLARDLGRALDGAAFLSGLRRIQTGCFDVSDAVLLDATVEEVYSQMAGFKKEDLGIPYFQIPKAAARDLSHGKTLPTSSFDNLPQQMPALAYFGDEIWAIVDEKEGQVIVKRGFGKQIEDSEAL